MFIVSGAPGGTTSITVTTLRQLHGVVNKYFRDLFAACFRGPARCASRGRGMLLACTSANADGSISAPATTTRRAQIDPVATASRHAAPHMPPPGEARHGHCRQCATPIAIRSCGNPFPPPSARDADPPDTRINDSRWWDSNPQPRLYESRALPLSYIGTQAPSATPAPGSVVSIGRRIKPAAKILGGRAKTPPRFAKIL
jgi:hypothetical protein